ncbi:uncharacterized protein RAG0_06015 [Rhynchosporium agropyri]|uniref:Peptidase A2 domain-containing protein n=1 Tax=Rhynchosporium agropyri TaxID=914238 RepID=A0A1E1KFM9_9HELO|nr:uncharacterized protein RAG0_06015 [Rhynchosporium agropyri]
MARPTDSDDDYAEADRERQRELRAGFVRSGIYMSSKHEKWKKGQRGAQTGENAQEADMAYTPQSGVPNEKTPAKRFIQVYCELQKNWHPFEAMFDTGTTENWMTPDTARKVNYFIQNVSPSTYYTFTGETLESSRGIQNVRWRIDNGNGPSTRSRYTNFHIASENAPFAVLFVKKDKEENRKRVEAEAQALATA